MKQILMGVILLLSFTVCTMAQDISIGLTKKHYDGQTTWDSFFEYDAIHSKLEYPISGRTYTLNVAAQKKFLFVNLEFDSPNLGNVRPTKFDTREGIDSDWIGNYLLYVSTFDTKYDKTDFTINAGVEFENTSLFASYYNYNAMFPMYNGWTQIVPGFNGPGLKHRRIGGLDSSYEVDYHALGLGINHVYHFCKDFLLDASFVFYPKFGITGTGYWNLRTLNFEHKSDNGQQITASFAFVLKPIKNVKFRVGYDLSKYWAEGKTTKAVERGYDWGFNHSVWKINSLTKGFNVGITYHFTVI